MIQSALFEAADGTALPSASPVRPDPDSERLLAPIQKLRLRQGAHPESVRREVSQLRCHL